MIPRAPKEQRTDADGTVFDSKSEMRRWGELKMLERAGEITELRRQVKFPLEINGRPIVIRSDGYPSGRRCVITLDFAYFDVRKNEHTVEDFKGWQTEAARLRIAVAEAIYGFRVLISGPAKHRRAA